jgi:molecular chaperone GrpE
MNGTEDDNEDGFEDFDDAEQAAVDAAAAHASAEAEAEAAASKGDGTVTPLGGDDNPDMRTYEDLVDENEALKDRLLRALSDGENLRRRSQREKEDAAKYAISAFARDLLEVSDNLTRALSTIQPEDLVAGDQHLRTLFEGVELTEKGLQIAYERHKIQLIDPKGARFDPNFHQAVAEIPGTDNPHGTVVDVMQTGYLIGERLLRPAMVTVAKGEPTQSGTAGGASSGGKTQPGGNLDTKA